MAVSIHTNIEDPVERLIAVKKSSGKAKQQQEDVGRDFVARLMDVVPSKISKSLLDMFLFSNTSLTISNVRGPDVPLYMAGAKMQMFMPMSIPFDGAGLNVTGFSYDGTLWVCLTACRKMVPDPGFLTKCMKESFAELKQASDEWAKKTQVETAKSPVNRRKKTVVSTDAVKKAVRRKSS